MENYTERRHGNIVYDAVLGLRNMIRNWIAQNVEGSILGKRTREEVSNAKKQAQLFLNTYRLDRASLTHTHPYFVLAKAISKICKEKGVKVIFYITPIDIEFARRVDILDEINPTIICIKNRFYEALSGEGALIYDFHDSLSEDDIVDTSGHLMESGRKKIYSLLSKSLLR